MQYVPETFPRWRSRHHDNDTAPEGFTEEAWPGPLPRLPRTLQANPFKVPER
jgi:hypothetical protein